MEKVRMRYFHMRGMKLVGCIMLAVVVAAALCVGPNASKAMAKEKVWKLELQSYTVPGKWDCQWAVPLKFTELVKKHFTGGGVKERSVGAVG